MVVETLSITLAPDKIKVLLYNSNPFMNKSLRKAIMTRLRLKNFNGNNSAENWNSCERQKFLTKVTISD